jgi:hypothetical protein
VYPIDGFPETTIFVTSFPSHLCYDFLDIALDLFRVLIAISFSHLVDDGPVALGLRRDKLPVGFRANDNSDWIAILLDDGHTVVFAGVIQEHAYCLIGFFG